jgi:hypothetical protein
MSPKRPLIQVAIVLALISAAAAAPDKSVRVSVTRLVAKIQRADYEGDRAALKRLYDELAPFVDSETLTSRIRYWRGFAMWRRAINGFNDSVDPKELEQDLKQALGEFDKVTVKEPGFAGARVGMISCLGFLIYINQKDVTCVEELITESSPIIKEAKALAPDNPRLLWVLGPILWITPPDRGGGQAKAIEMYEKGLELSRKSKVSDDRLEPSWGEPELLMNLAWSNLNKTTPDPKAAEGYAHSALEIVPYWHYVRDILMPQILAAKAPQTERPVSGVPPN